ncbi:MAG: radical SAM protein [Thermodesulfobacteriota bacterium]|nr:radical SAM protein [Thermodesulfobacteriota bacterium]
MKILFTSVFGPYGVDDAFGRKENIMELFHNQVTREQGIFSFRINHQSAGLYLMAENISVPAVVLDFPSLKEFRREVAKGYDYIGISFIVPNFVKARKMAEIIRETSPHTKIILGGHGTSIENIDSLISCDHVCRGDGVRFMRELLDEDVDAPIKHPMLYSAFNKHLMGIPLAQDAGVVMTGVGCSNGCRFCCTTHYFQKVYTPFLKTGREIYEVCERMEQELGVTDFFVMDENFLKTHDRAHELVHELEKNGKSYSFNIFSSAEAVTRIGIDFMVRLGVNFLWMGVESKKEVYEKNKGIDFPSLVKALRDNGIAVLASGILFSEHHDKTTIFEDIDFMTGLNADLVQFMQLGPLPGTKLFKDYEKQGRLRKDIPYEEWHGQHQIWFTHPHFTQEESAVYLKNAFIADYKRNGPSILRIMDTTIRGVLNTRHYKHGFMRLRHEEKCDRAKFMYPLLGALYTHAPTPQARQLALDVRAKYESAFGRPDWLLRMRTVAVQCLILSEKVRSLLIPNNMRQPYAITTSFRMAPEKSRVRRWLTPLKQRIDIHRPHIQWHTPLVPVNIAITAIFNGVLLRTLGSYMGKLLRIF